VDAARLRVRIISSYCIFCWIFVVITEKIRSGYAPTSEDLDDGGVRTSDQAGVVRWLSAQEENFVGHSGFKYFLCSLICVVATISAVGSQWGNSTGDTSKKIVHFHPST